MAEMGSHRELLGQDGIYAELWNSEFYFMLLEFFANSFLAQELSLAQDVDLERSQGEDNPKV